MCHLVGYDHIEEDEKALMRAVEEKVMRALDLTRTK
jgi:ssRNA-specific RNase YbeY (16S rRNA maturation enzyme)